MERRRERATPRRKGQATPQDDPGTVQQSTPAQMEGRAMPDEQEQEQPRSERTQEEIVRELRESVGAAAEQSPTLRDFVQQSFVAKVVQDPMRVPAAWLLPGYLGESSEQDHTRLYLVANLAYWIEIPNEAIFHV